MESFLLELYKDAYVISKIRQVVEEIRTQNENLALKILNANLAGMQHFCEECLEDGYEEAEDLKRHLLSMAEIRDVIFLGDVLENAVIPIMERWMQSRAAIEQTLDEDYDIESTATGYLTLKHRETERYLHSNNDPMDEARKAVARQYDASKKSYCVWGVGLGYHIYQLYLITDGSIPIRVYEPNQKMLEYAMAYGVLSWIPADLVEIIDQTNLNAFISDRQKGNGEFYLAPYVKILSRSGQRSGIMEEYIQSCSSWEASRNLKINFYRNMEQNLPDIHELKKDDWKKEMVIIAGGPSVDHVIGKLREWQGKKNLIAVGTICKRLLQEGIKPDYMVIMDPYDTVYGQIQGLEDCGVTLLLNMLAYWKVARSYRGQIYSMCVDGPLPEMKEYTSSRGLKLWESGGTVTALAMDVALHFGAKTIYLAGVDLAYPGGISHASGTEFRKQKDITGMTPIRGVNGETVYADEAFQLYRKWLEYRIKQTIGVRFVNMSNIGAKIEGTEMFPEKE